MFDIFYFNVCGPVIIPIPYFYYSYWNPISDFPVLYSCFDIACFEIVR